MNVTPIKTKKPRARKAPKPNKVRKHADLGLPVELAVPLHAALSRKRSADSPGEGQYVAWLVQYVSKYTPLQMVDGSGNLYFKINCADGTDPTTLFVAHTDTMSYDYGMPNTYGISGRVLHAMDGDVLGADNGAGCSLMCWLIAHKVPGTYIFTRMEECGGIGAKAVRDTFPTLLRKHNRAITFDRRGVADIITHQGGSRCCSDDFAWELACQLNEADDSMLYCPSDRGVYTDTKEFIRHIPECTNISTGYDNEHGPSEILNLTHYEALAHAILKVDWERLPVERSVSTVSPRPRSPFEGNLLDSEELTIYDEALVDFSMGKKKGLLDLLSQDLYPDDPAMAMRFLDMEKLDEAIIKEARYKYPEDGIAFLLTHAMVGGAVA